MRVHGIEHACIAVLTESGRMQLAGITGPGRFIVELANDGHASSATVRRAGDDAIRRIAGGELDLAYSPRCGTGLFVALALVSLVIVSGAVVGIIGGWSAHAIVAVVASSTALAAFASRPLGLLVQRY